MHTYALLHVHALHRFGLVDARHIMYVGTHGLKPVDAFFQGNADTTLAPLLYTCVYVHKQEYTGALYVWYRYQGHQVRHLAEARAISATVCSMQLAHVDEQPTFVKFKPAAQIYHG